MKSKAVKAALVDGLLSDSATHIHVLLQSQDQQLMSDTMQQLSRNPKAIDTFLRVLTDLAAKHPQSAERALRWLNRLIESHSGYIASSPELTGRLARLRDQLQTRLAAMQRLLMLKGRLDLLLGLSSAAAAGDLRRLQQPAAVHRDSDDSEVTEGEDDGDEEGEGEEDEGPDDLAGQLLGNENASGSEADMMESDEVDEDDGSDPSMEEDDEDDDDDDEDDEEDDEEEEDEPESNGGVSGAR